MRPTSLLAGVCLALAVVTPASAQWINLKTPGLPRLPDGNPDLEAPTPRTADGKPDLSGLWRNDAGDRYNNNIAVDLDISDVAPPAHALFIKRSLEFGKDSMETQCLPMGPAYTTTRYREFRIVQTPTLIVFAYDDGMHREIFMDGRTLETDPNPSWMGYSVGRWEGDTLVVDSNGYTDRSWLDFGGHPHTEALRITERFTRRNIGTIDRQVTMTDPAIFAKPIVITIPVKLRADMEMLEGFCENHQTIRTRIASTKPARAANVPPATLARYTGTYDTVDDGTKHVLHITNEGSNLWLDYDAKGRELLIPLSSTQYSWAGTIVEFAPGTGGAMTISLHYAEGTETGSRRK
jgi:hypothetical protein